ncbi:hypothetical protein GCM10023232_25750 [Sphingosinicella ginsenosidimutans]
MAGDGAGASPASNKVGARPAPLSQVASAGLSCAAALLKAIIRANPRIRSPENKQGACQIGGRLLPLSRGWGQGGSGVGSPPVAASENRRAKKAD